jgi:diphosphomevalonate decarboxylase
MKATAKAPSNIAFIKYWGKKNDQLRLPLNSSISMNLTGAYTITTVDFNPKYTRDEISIDGEDFSDAEVKRVINALNTIRQQTKESHFAKVATKNTFPKGAGAAASASGFAALTVAAVKATAANFSEKELTILARQGSGSACRSIPSGYVEWLQGTSSDDSFAYSLYPPEYWDLRDVLVIVDASMKKVSTTAGMEQITTSPALSARLQAIPTRIVRLKEAMAKKNFSQLGTVIEEDCLDMHHVMQTQVPVLNYWSPTTEAIMKAVIAARKVGLSAYFTIDAGPNVHILCEGKDEADVLSLLKSVSGIQTIIQNQVAAGTTLVSEHLF